MKTIYTIFICLFSFIFFASPLTHTVTYSSSITTVSCSIGDTLKFYGNSNAVYAVSINSAVIINPTSSNSFPFYLGFYVILGGESSYAFLTNVNQPGSIFVNNIVTTSKEEDLTNKIKISPNPFFDVITVLYNRKIVMNIFTSDGFLALNKMIEPGETKIDLSGLKSGIYIIRLDNLMLKIIKV